MASPFERAGGTIRFLLAFVVALAAAVPVGATFTPPGISQREATALALGKVAAQIGYIERERRRADVPDDFAASALNFSRQQLAAAEPAIRQEAERNARRILGAGSSTAWLRSWPDPMRVKADIASRSRGQSDLVIAARQAGRLLMFNAALPDFAGTIFDARMPPDVQARRVAYLVHYLDIRDRWTPRFERACPESGPCRRRDFHEISGDYRYGLEAATEAANRYLPADQRVQFIDVTDSRGTRTPPPPIPQPEPKSWWVDFWPGLTAVIFTVIGLFLLVAFLRYLMREADPKPPSIAYGSATFAKPETGLPPPERLFHGTFFGFSYQDDKQKEPMASPIVSAPENHTLIVAPTRTGKGTRVIVPTLLLYQSSLITLDPKGENAAITARYRRDQLGHKVHIVNPWGSHAALYESYGFPPAAINPLDVLDRNDPGVAATATAMARAICHRPSETNPIWQNQAAALLTALLLWVTDQPGETKTLGRIADLVSGGPDGEDLRKKILPQMTASSSFQGAMRKSIGQLRNLADETYSGVIFNLTEALQFLVDPLLVTATDHSTFDLADLTEEGTTVYLVIPDEQLRTQATWVKLLLAAVTSTFKRHKPQAKGRRGMFLLDEFPALGQVDSFVTDIAVIGGSGLDITIAVQDLSQLESLYGKAAGTILGNCGWKWFCNVQDLQTADYVSKMLGTATQATESRTIGQNSDSTAYGETARPLRTADEVMAMGKDYAMVFRPGARPYGIETCDYWRLKGKMDRLLKNGPACVMPDFDAVDRNPYRIDLGIPALGRLSLSDLFRIKPPDPFSTKPVITQSAVEEPATPEPEIAEPEIIEPAMPEPETGQPPYGREDALDDLELEDPVSWDEIQSAYDMLQLRYLPPDEEGDKIREKWERALRYLSPPTSGNWDL